VLSDYRRVLDWQLDLLNHNQLHNSVRVYYTLQLTTTESLLFLWRPRLQLCSHRCNQLLRRPLPSLGTVPSWLSTPELYSQGTDHKENTVSDSYTVVCHYRNRPPKKTPPIVESCRLPSNGCKQTLTLLTVDPQRARHNIVGWQDDCGWNENWQGKLEYSEKICPQCQFVRHKSHMT
jgi:hypothetical protein